MMPTTTVRGPSKREAEQKPLTEFTSLGYTASLQSSSIGGQMSVTPEPSNLTSLQSELPNYLRSGSARRTIPTPL